jgi:hypothetical protein
MLPCSTLKYPSSYWIGGEGQEGYRGFPIWKQFSQTLKHPLRSRLSKGGAGSVEESSEHWHNAEINKIYADLGIDFDKVLPLINTNSPIPQKEITQMTQMTQNFLANEVIDTSQIFGSMLLKFNSLAAPTPPAIPSVNTNISISTANSRKQNIDQRYPKFQYPSIDPSEKKKKLQKNKIKQVQQLRDKNRMEKRQIGSMYPTTTTTSGGKSKSKSKTKKRRQKQKSKRRKPPYKNRSKSNKRRPRRKHTSRFYIKKKTKKRR